MRKIAEVIPGADYLITVRFDNNYAVIIDMKQKLYTARFSELRNKEVYNSATTDGKSILWPGGMSIAITEIKEFIKK